MEYLKLIDILNEGPRDPNIFKAIFTAGIPGSGKTTLVKKLTAGTGMKTVNFDELYEYLVRSRNDVDSVVKVADRLLDSKLSTYLSGRLGVVIDKTSWDYEKVINLKEKFEALGYDTRMVYVNTDVDIAKQRVKNRYKSTGRDVDEKYIDTVFAQLHGNLGKYQRKFSDNFVIVDNSVDFSNPSSAAKYVETRVDKFLNSKPRNRVAAQWIRDTP